MEIRTTLRLGERGTRRLVDQFGTRLVCVRYRCDPAAAGQGLGAALGVVRGLGIERRVVAVRRRGIWICDPRCRCLSA